MEQAAIISQAHRDQLRALLRRGEIAATARRTGLTCDTLERFLDGANGPKAAYCFEALTSTVRTRRRAEQAAARAAERVLADLAPASAEAIS